MPPKDTIPRVLRFKMELNGSDNSSVVTALHPYRTELERMGFISSSRNATFNFSKEEAFSIIEDYKRDHVFDGETLYSYCACANKRMCVVLRIASKSVGNVINPVYNNG